MAKDMIFITAGTQEPFDRLLMAADDLALQMPDVTFIVQALRSTYTAKNFEVADFVTASQFASNVKNAKLVISHAGMGTIISALEYQTPLVVVPRLLKFKEHRNEHQLATAKKMEALGYVDVVYDEKGLIAKVLSLWPDKFRIRPRINSVASQSLTDSITRFIAG